MTESVQDVYRLCCFDCGSDESLEVAVSTWARLEPDGVETFGDIEWDDHHAAVCRACGARGTVADFTCDEENDDDEDEEASEG